MEALCSPAAIRAGPRDPRWPNGTATFCGSDPATEQNWQFEPGGGNFPRIGVPTQACHTLTSRANTHARASAAFRLVARIAAPRRGARLATARRCKSAVHDGVLLQSAVGPPARVSPTL